MAGKVKQGHARGMQGRAREGRGASSCYCCFVNLVSCYMINQTSGQAGVRAIDHASARACALTNNRASEQASARAGALPSADGKGQRRVAGSAQAGTVEHAGAQGIG
jgi:hypothetical protein